MEYEKRTTRKKLENEKKERARASLEREKKPKQEATRAKKRKRSVRFQSGPKRGNFGPTLAEPPKKPEQTNPSDHLSGLERDNYGVPLHSFSFFLEPEPKKPKQTKTCDQMDEEAPSQSGLKRDKYADEVLAEFYSISVGSLCEPLYRTLPMKTLKSFFLSLTAHPSEPES